jgi:hypothetical protein
LRRKAEEARGDERKFHNELHDLYSSPNGWVEIVARWGEKSYVYRNVLENPKKLEHLEELCLDGRVIFRWILKEEDGAPWTGYV